MTYIGKVKGTDTKNVTVIKITDNDSNTVKKEQKKMKIKAADEKVYATAGCRALALSFPMIVFSNRTERHQRQLMGLSLTCWKKGFFC